MKRYWIAALLVLAMLMALLSGCGGKKQNESDEESTMPRVQTDPDTLVCTNGNKTLRFHKEDGKWVWLDDTEFPLDESYVQELLDTLHGLEALVPIASAGELAEYGLESVKVYVLLRDPSGSETCFYLGKAADDGYYMYDGTVEHGIYIAPTTLMQQISRSIYDMALLPTLPKLTLSNITAMTVTAGEVEQQFTVKDGKWYLDQADVTEKMTAVTDALGRLAVAGCVDYRPSSGAAGICGLTKDAAVLTVSYQNNMVFSLTIGLQRNDHGYYATVNEDSTIYLLPTELAQPLLSLAKDGL